MTGKLRHVALFAGIHGFKGFDDAGMETVAFVEIDKDCQRVLRRHYPHTIILDDVQTAGKHNLPECDVISFGSPCQDLSIAGKRAGLGGERSGLFFEAIRIIKELRPAFAVWENVPNAISSNAGRDFLSILSAFRSVGACDICWRVLDAQHFGVPQRRRRLFLVADFRGDRAGQILIESSSSYGDTPTRQKAREGNTGITGTLTASGAREISGRANELDFIVTAATQKNTVRRLTPTECERLMGFPDGYTAVDKNSKPISDSARYRMLGNSVVVNVTRWIGERIVKAIC